MATVPDLSPLELHRDGNHLSFCVPPPRDILAELPASYEELVAARLRNVLVDAGPITVEVDLQGQAGLSSRQLGALIALHRALRPRFGCVPLRNVSPGVRHLLELTRTDQLFELGPEA